MPIELATEKYLYNPKVSRDWHLPCDIKSHNGEWLWSSIDWRNYSWFSRMSPGVRGHESEYLFGDYARGIPNDIHSLIIIECNRYDDDGHSHNWLWVKEILEKEELQDYQQYKWLQQYIDDPEHTKMVFFFDN